MNSFETLCDDGFHAEQAGAFRGPVARASRAVLLSGDDYQRHAFRLITHSRIIDAHAFAVRLMNRDTAFNSWHHQVLDSHVCESAADHYFVIATPRAITIEVFDIDAAPLQVQARGRRRLDRTGGTDVIG